MTEPTPQDAKERLRAIEDTLLRFIAGDLEQRIPVSARGDHVDAVATGINILVEEFTTISAERDSHQALRKVSDHLAEAQEIAHLGSWEWDPIGDTMIWSDETYRILGFAPGEVPPSYERYVSRVHFEDRVDFERRIEEALELGHPFQLEHRVRRSGDEVRVLACKGRIVEAPLQDARHIHATIHDITAIKEAERRVEEARSQGQRLDAALLELSRGLAETDGGLQRPLQAIARSAALALRVERCSLWLFTDDRRAIRCIELYTLSDDSHRSGAELTAAEYPAYFKALESQRVVAAHDAHTDPRTCEFSEGYLGLFGITAMLDTPIRQGGVMIGVVCHEHTGPARRWTSEEQHFGVAIGTLVAQALEAEKRQEIRGALRASEARYRTHLEHTPAVTYTAGPERGQFSYVSPKIEDLLGHRPEAWRASRTLWWDSVHPDDRQRVGEELARCTQAFEPIQITYRLHTADGGLRWVRDEATPGQGEEPGTIVWQGVLLDVTELTVAKQSAEAFQAAEAHWRSLFDQAPHFIITTDLDLVVTSINRPIAPLTQADVVGSPLGHFEAPRSAGTVRRNCDAALRTGQVQEFEIFALGPHSSWAWYDCHVGTIEHEGQVAGFLFLALDSTETRRLRQDLANKRTLEAIGRLTGGITHDFNNIMMAIAGYADLALSALEDDAPAHALVGKLRKTARRAQALVNRLPTFGPDPIAQPRLVDVNALLSDMPDLIRPLMGPDIHLNIISADEPMVVRIDPSQFEQVVLNLAVNARDAMAEDGTLAIEVVRVPNSSAPQGSTTPSDNLIRLSVTDNGAGMDEYTRERLFEPFFTTKPGRTGQGGLGLFTCYDIADSVGGRIEVHSKLGEGATIDVFLPEAPGQPEPTSLDKPVVSAAKGQETILAVDDDPDINDLLTEVLQAYGYTVLRAEDGEDALEVLDRLGDPHIDLLLTDVMMPRMGGQELAQILCERRPSLPVIFASGFVEKATNLRLDMPGMHFVRKPISPIALAKEIRQILDSTPGDAASPNAPPT